MGQGFPNQRIGVNISAGTTRAQTGTVVLSNSNGVSFGMQTSASSFVVTASFGQSVGPGAISAGTTLVTSGTVVFSNSNGISFGLNGQTLTARMPQLSFWRNEIEPGNANSLVPSSSTLNLSLQRITVPLEIAATELDLLAHLTVVGSTQGSYTLRAAVYAFSASTLSSLSSTSISVSWSSGTQTSAISSNYGGQSGTRWRSVALGTWNLTPGEYMLGLMGSIAGVAGTTGSMTVFGRSAVSVVGDAPGGGNHTQFFAWGLFSAGTGAFPSSIHLSAINQTGAAVQAQPHFRLIGTF